MANLPEQSIWEPGVYQFEKTDAVEGGPDGVDNKPLKHLTNRTLFLKEEVEKRAPLIDAALTGIPTAPTAAPGTSTTQIATTAFIATALAALVDSSPATLDTLNELAAALGDDANFAATMAAALASKADILDGIPIGTPSYCMTATPPTAHLKRNGALVSRVTFADLWAFASGNGLVVSEAAWAGGMQGHFGEGDGATSFRLPEGRSFVIRGWDDGYGHDTGRALGSFQLDALQGHHHEISYPYTGTSGGPLTVGLGTFSSSNIFQNTATSLLSDGSNGAPRLAHETRMVNIAYTPIIKYRGNP